MGISEQWSKAKYTAIISDLHLTEAEPVNARFPLWKKYKTREFFFDNVFGDFLSEIEKRANGEKIELILNGDIFDFDSVLKMPEEPAFRISDLERKRGLFARPERAQFKIQVITDHHAEFFWHLRSFLRRGHRVVFVIGNHDVELHFPEVQAHLLEVLDPDERARGRIRFCEWFYISNADTLIEHGNQYDPYCVCDDPVQPFARGYNYKTLRLPFGNLACRYILNGLGFFNPHVDSNYIMSVREYVGFFVKYMLRAQPLIILTWLGGAMMTLLMSVKDRLSVAIRDPLRIEDRIEEIAARSNATPRMVRELRELAAEPATGDIFAMARELWLDRALIVFFAFFLILEAFVLINTVFHVSFFWMFIPLFLMLPFFLFYSQSIQSLVSGYKEPDERVLSTAGQITKTNRIVYGHTHIMRHELIGSVEHLNSGCWSPAFLDVECTKPVGQKTFVWIEPEDDLRRAHLYQFADGAIQEIKALPRSGG